MKNLMFFVLYQVDLMYGAVLNSFLVPVGRMIIRLLGL